MSQLLRKGSNNTKRETGKTGGIKMEEKKEIKTMQQLNEFCLNNNKRAVFLRGKYSGLKYQGDWI